MKKGNWLEDIKNQRRMAQRETIPRLTMKLVDGKQVILYKCPDCKDNDTVFIQKEYDPRTNITKLSMGCNTCDDVKYMEWEGDRW